MDDHSPKLSLGCYRYISDSQIFNGNTTLVRNTLMDLLWEKRFCRTRQISADNTSCWRGKMYVIKLYIIILSTDSIVQLVQKNLTFLVNLRIYWQGFGWCQRNFHRHKSFSSGSYLWNNSSPCKFYMIPLTPNIIRNSPYWLPNNSHYVSLENLVLDLLVI